MKKRLFLIILYIGLFGCINLDNAFSFVERKDGKTYIIDRTGYQWDVTQAESLGFKPDHFQYGIGKNAFTTLDDSLLSNDTKKVSENLRIIGIAEDPHAQAYSVSKLVRHEIANSTLGSKPVAVGY
jgi:hypothetical protein